MDRRRTDVTVLIADDEPTMLGLLAHLIQDRMGLQVLTVADGDSALDVLAKRDVDILLTDMRMPGCHGAELVRRVKESWPCVDVVAMTAFAVDYPYLEIVEAGASDFLSKPFQLAEMEAKLALLMEVRDTRRQLALENARISLEIREVTDQVMAHSLAESKYRALFELSMTAALILDPDSFRISEVNHAFLSSSGLERDDVLGKPVTDFLRPVARLRFDKGMEMIMRCGQGTLADMEMETHGASDVLFDFHVSFIALGTDRIIHVACRDVTEQKMMQERLFEIAQTDGLTGLYNKRTFTPRLELAVSEAKRHGHALSLMSIDLDNFKQCNDKHGHDAGDAVLREVGALIREHIRETDEGFRYGGDEFVLLLPKADARVAGQVAERLRAAFSDSENHGASMSIGIAEYQPGMDASAFYRASDAALYQAKSEGKDTISTA